MREMKPRSVKRMRNNKMQSTEYHAQIRALTIIYLQNNREEERKTSGVDSRMKFFSSLLKGIKLTGS